jgi:hypothetical protein
MMNASNFHLANEDEFTPSVQPMLVAIEAVCQVQRFPCLLVINPAAALLAPELTSRACTV